MARRVRIRLNVSNALMDLGQLYRSQLCTKMASCRQLRECRVPTLGIFSLLNYPLPG